MGRVECKHVEETAFKDEPEQDGGFYRRNYCVKCGMLMRTRYYELANDYDEINKEEKM